MFGNSLGYGSGIADIPIIGALFAFLWVFLVIILALYVYLSFAYMAIARKANYKYPAIAWIPGIGPLIIINRIAEMHWWPILLILANWIPIIGIIASAVLFVFSIIWLWKTFEKINKPGWWAILFLIPIVNIIILGIAAWSKD
ncbi:MAG: hypothetical protein QW117_02045 [Candidatus Pacearchaeota archaeon]